MANITTSERGVDVCRKLQEKFERSQKFVTDRILMWFDTLPESAQSALLDSVTEELRPHYAEMVLKHLDKPATAGKIGPKKSKGIGPTKKAAKKKTTKNKD